MIKKKQIQEFRDNLDIKNNILNVIEQAYFNIKIYKQTLDTTMSESFVKSYLHKIEITQLAINRLSERYYNV